ncbi:MAG TPA: FAD-binding oxidoreductase [Gaiellaceae bacterium]|jgi:FAD/FMN-containing dehydrogenase
MNSFPQFSGRTVPSVAIPLALLADKLVFPGDPGWDEARLAWNLAVDQQPAAVALPESVEDVMAVVELASREGLRVAAQGTGHNAGPLGSLEDTILVKTSRMRGVSIDPVARTARAEAGVLWGEVSEAAGEHGLAALAGSSPDVGVVGYTLGGGVSWLARKYGLAANSLLAVELVTADGRFVRADRENEPELFWALRGGGGSFGVVTAVEFTLYPVAELYAGVLFFPIERAAEILGAWREWVDTVPDEVMSVGRLLQLPPIPEVPEFLRGRSFVVVEAAILADEAAGAELVRPLRELGPEIDTLAMIPATALKTLHMDPEQPVPGAGDGGMLSDFTPEAIDALVETVPGSPLLSVEVRHLRGALAKPSPEHGALASLEGGFLYFSVGIAPTPELKEAVERHAELVKAVLEPWSAGRTYLNFVETPTDSRRFFGEVSHRRLRAIKARVDPADLFRSNHPV